MESNHFDDPINGCVGGQFIDPPPFALWTIIPFIRSRYFSIITRIPTYILLFLGILIGGISALIGVVLSFVFLPITFPLGLLLHLDISPCRIDSSDKETLLILPGVAFCAIIGSIFFLVLELLWLPVPLLFSTCLFPLFLYSRDSSDPDRPSVISYFKCLVDEELSGFWCYPVQSIIYGIAGLFRSFEDD